MTHPYTDLPPTAYWRTAVGDRNPLEAEGLWVPKVPLTGEDRVVTFGSCFAQHISRALVRTGFEWFDAEPGPKLASDALRSRFNYGVFSARTGNIYTARALAQWLAWAAGDETPPDEAWEKDGRFYDPFRPAIEPDGFASAEEMHASRAVTLRALRQAAAQCTVFVFTLGLTEAWENRDGGYTYATCPGTNAGTFDPAQHEFRNYDYPTVQADMDRAIGILRRLNPDVRVLLTVSPVPLTATAAGRHVVVSTTYSKSVLRAVAGQMADADPDIDYFPSYEIITAPSFRGMFYNPNMRTVAARGVAFVMEHFMALQTPPAPAEEGETETVAAESAPDAAAPEPAKSADDLRCEEEILDAFAPRAQG